MKNWKLSALLNTPLGVVIVIGLLILMVESLIMLVIVSMHNVILYDQVMEEIVAGIIDPILLTLIVAPVLYFLVFRKLHESEVRFRALADAAGDLIFTINADGEVGYVNEMAARALHATPEQVVGKRLRDLFPPEAFEQQLHGLQKVFETGEPLYMEAPTRFPHGEVWQDTWLVPLYDANGSIGAVLGAARDITERKNSEAAFHTIVGSAAANAGAAFFHESVRSLSTWLGVECVIIGELVDENRVRALAMQLDGKAIEHYEYALPGTPCNNVASKGYCEYPEGVCQLFPSDKDLLDMGAEAYIGTPIRNKNGKTIGVLCAISRHKIVPPPMLKGVFEIIAARAGTEIERKRAEDALRNSEEQYRTMIESSNDMIWTLAADGRFTFINQQAADVTGRSIADWLGKTFEPLVLEEDLQMVLEIHGKIMKGEKAHYEVRGKKADGGILTLSVNASPIFKDGKVSGTISFARDITEQKLAEAKLAEHTEELRRWHDITMGREMRTLELKREINELLRQAGQPPRYLSV